MALVSNDERKKLRTAYVTEWREMRGMSLAELAKAVGFDEKELDKAEREDGVLLHEFMDMIPIATALGVRPSMLYRKPTAYDQIVKGLRRF